jgi:hypothetical protein
MDPAVRIGGFAVASRGFPRGRRRGAAHLFAYLGEDRSAPLDDLAAAATPVVDATTALVGPDRALAAARALTAFAHGFTSMEQAGAFRLGGRVDEAFDTGLDALIAGLIRTDD